MYDGGRLLQMELFLSMSCLTRLRSVRAMAVPVPSLREYMPPYCFAHSVNIYCISRVELIILEVALLEICAFAGNLMEIAYQWQSWRSYLIAVSY